MRIFRIGVGIGLTVIGLWLLLLWANRGRCEGLYARAKTATDSLIVDAGSKCWAWTPYR